MKPSRHDYNDWTWRDDVCVVLLVIGGAACWFLAEIRDGLVRLFGRRRP